MKLPTKRQRLLRQYERVIFYSDYSRSQRVYSLYLLLRPIFGWLIDKLITLGLEETEAESEIYIMIDQLHKNFNHEKSSIIPYLERYIPWRAAGLIDKWAPSAFVEVPLEFCQEESYSLTDEIYLSIPNVLFEDRWLCGKLQRSEKYLIFLILAADTNRLTGTNLAEAAGISRKKFYNIIYDLREVLNQGGYYGSGPQGNY